MKCRVSLAVQMVLVLAAPSLVLAQHAASMPAAHSGVAARAGTGRSFSPPPVPARQGHWPSWTPSHPVNDGRRGTGYRGPSPYLSGGYFPFSYGLPFTYGLALGDDQQDAGGPTPTPQQPDQPVINYGQEPRVSNAPPAFRPSYQGLLEFAPVHAQPATTLVFRDGRPPAQVRNYALTGSTLYALDGETRQEIPLSLLNVPATVAANRAAGVDFALPVSSPTQ